MDDNPQYRDERARFYDAVIADADRPDVDYYVDLARDVDGPVLEAACGTGRIYLQLLEAGVDAAGFDLSADALDVLEAAAAERGLEPSVWQAELTTFESDRPYESVICPFNAMQNVATVDEQLAALEAVYDALDASGQFVFDVFVPSFDVIRESYGEWQTESVTYRGERHEVRTRTRIVDEIEQRFATETELYDPNGSLVFAEEDVLSMLPAQQVELLARQSPFGSWSVTGDFTGEPLADGHSIQVWSMRKTDHR